jgi:hypothetical protein
MKSYFSWKAQLKQGIEMNHSILTIMPNYFQNRGELPFVLPLSSHAFQVGIHEWMRFSYKFLGV